VSRKSEQAPPGDLLPAVVEALVFSSGEPISLSELVETLDGVEPLEVEAAIEALEQRYREQQAGLRIERVAGGLQLATRSEVGPWVRRFFRNRNRTRVSPAALETLSVIAYKQPVTAPEIQAIRGKDPSASLKTLLEKKLVRILGKKKVVGRPLLYGTSKQFLMHFGLDSLDDLPAFEEFEQLIDSLESLQALPTEEAADEAPEDDELLLEAADLASPVPEPGGNGRDHDVAVLPAEAPGLPAEDEPVG
jgi:segregation and condensation protein B